jgi:hypothetical protein
MSKINSHIGKITYAESQYRNAFRAGGKYSVMVDKLGDDLWAGQNSLEEGSILII